MVLNAHTESVHQNGQHDALVEVLAFNNVFYIVRYVTQATIASITFLMCFLFTPGMVM